MNGNSSTISSGGRWEPNGFRWPLVKSSSSVNSWTVYLFLAFSQFKLFASIAEHDCSEDLVADEINARLILARRPMHKWRHIKNDCCLQPEVMQKNSMVNSTQLSLLHSMLYLFYQVTQSNMQFITYLMIGLPQNYVVLKDTKKQIDHQLSYQAILAQPTICPDSYKVQNGKS